MREIRRSVQSNEREGMACGPVSTYAVDAEIVVEDEGKEIFLHAQYVAEADAVLFEAHTQSIYDVYKEFNNMNWDDNEAFDAAIAKRDKIDKEARISDDVNIEERYAEQYQQLLQMIEETVEEDGVEYISL
ncbi:MAG: hypothetical protein Q4B26_20375 [Eubacteriales bacterium]|nr:hypothetical protein [Eubacteriales bacterium]